MPFPPETRRIPYDTNAFAGQGDYSELRSPLLQEYKVPLSLLQTVYRKKPASPETPQPVAAAVNNERAVPIIHRRTSALIPEEGEDESGRLTPQALDQLHHRRTTRELFSPFFFSWSPSLWLQEADGLLDTVCSETL